MNARQLFLARREDVLRLARWLEVPRNPERLSQSALAHEVAFYCGDFGSQFCHGTRGATATTKARNHASV